MSNSCPITEAFREVLRREVKKGEVLRRNLKDAWDFAS